MKQKRLGTMMLAAAMAASLFAGCQKAEGSADSLETGNVQEEGSQQETQEQEPLETKAPNKTGTLERAELPGNGAEDPDSTESDNSESDNSESDSTESNSTESDTPQPEAPKEANYPEITSDGSIQDFGNVVVVNNAAYELYEYLDKPADNYVQALNTIAGNLNGKADMYNLIIPLSSGITFPDNLQDQIHSEDQQEGMDKIQGRLADNIKTVDSYGSLMEHRKEYIYFRTDHHWTGLGAYYAYEDFCAAKGIEPEPIDSYETVVFDNFLGSFYYNDTNNCEQLKATPDSVTAYRPNMDAIMHIVDPEGVEYDSQVIYDESNAPESLKYCCFIAGDNPYTEIVNNERTDGSSCVVVKDSFGNAFVPFLVDHYQTIHVIDYRYWIGSISDFSLEKGVDDVIFVNNLSMTRSNKEVGKLYRVI